MAVLTQTQKKALDEAVLNAFKEVMKIATSDDVEIDDLGKRLYSRFYNDGMTYNNINSLIHNKLDFPMKNPSTSISYSLARLSKTYPIYNVWGHYKYMENGVVLDNNKTTFTKKANRLYFDCKADLYYDFNTKTYSIENLLDNIVGYCFLKDGDFNQALQYEWLFNYITDIRVIKDIILNLPDDALKTMPKGLYQEIEKNNGELDFVLLKNYYNYLKYGKYYKFVEALTGYNNTIYKKIDCFLEKYTFENLFKIMKNTLLNGDLDDDPSDLIKTYYTLVENDYEVTLDTNRDLSYNMRILKDIQEKEKNEMLAKQLQKLNFINGYSNENYIIKVPQSQEEKREEGQMQNNCVGYYYDDRILNGYDLIYFIRKKANPKHSYITCRYNLDRKATVEYRTVNNGTVTDNKAIDLIKTLDEIINTKLKAKG